MIEVLDASSSRWNETLNTLPIELHDIYFTSDYHQLYETNSSYSRCFIYKEGPRVAFYPFLLNRIENYGFDKLYYDIETVYGYGGPISNSNDIFFLEKFEKAFLAYCQEQNIIAEFIRFHPLLKNERIFQSIIDVEYNRLTVYLDISKSIEEIWRTDISSKNRNMIRKAEKSDLRAEEGYNYRTFKDMYVATMEKLQANQFYYFQDNYYRQISQENDYFLLNILKDNNIIAGAIFMFYGIYCHYHLAGSLVEYLKYAPNNFLIWHAIQNAKARGAKFFHLGGGLTNSIEDSLFKFKSSFSKNYLKFYVGKRIHNQEIYIKLIDQWEKKSKRRAKLFLQYRLP